MRLAHIFAHLRFYKLAKLFTCDATQKQLDIAAIGQIVACSQRSASVESAFIHAMQPHLRGLTFFASHGQHKPQLV